MEVLIGTVRNGPTHVFFVEREVIIYEGIQEVG